MRTNGSSSHTICKSVLCCVWKITKCQSVANFCSNIAPKDRSKVRKIIFSVNITRSVTPNVRSLVEKFSANRRKLYLKYSKAVLYRDLTHTHTKNTAITIIIIISSEPLRLLNNVPTPLKHSFKVRVYTIPHIIHYSNRIPTKLLCHWASTRRFYLYKSTICTPRRRVVRVCVAFPTKCIIVYKCFFFVVRFCCIRWLGCNLRLPLILQHISTFTA